MDEGQERERAIREHLRAMVDVTDEQIANQRGAISLTESKAIECHVLEALDLRPHYRILDLGCGTGLLSEAIAPLVAQLISCDLEIGLCHRAARRLQPWPHSAVCCCDGRALPFPPDTFDRVFFYDAILYLTDVECLTLLRECHRVLRPRGVVLVGDVCHPLREWRRRRVHDDWPLWRCAYTQARRYALIVRRALFSPTRHGSGWYTFREFRQMAAEAGYTVRFLEHAPTMPFRYWRYDAILTPC
ncbi:MAG: class I SAM-dependent methyltransferase [Chloroflexi bacterium]|nr:class I SAM-dependent methyltransferase [Chloroflexota bacterium]